MFLFFLSNGFVVHHPFDAPKGFKLYPSSSRLFSELINSPPFEDAWSDNLSHTNYKRRTTEAAEISFFLCFLTVNHVQFNAALPPCSVHLFFLLYFLVKIICVDKDVVGGRFISI